MLVEPFKSVGNLEFNEKRQSIREKLDESVEPGMNEFGEKKEYFDFFPDSDIIVFYDENDRAQAFNFFEQNPVFNGVDLLSEPFVKLAEMFSNLDPSLEIDETSFTSYKYGIGANCPYKGKDGMATPESVIVFYHGYF